MAKGHMKPQKEKKKPKKPAPPKPKPGESAGAAPLAKGPVKR